MRYEFDGEVWRYSGQAAWHFVTLPVELTAGLKALRGSGPAFGSIRVEVGVGASRWRTSLFPDSKSGAFLLPLKAEIRRRENLAHGDTARFTVELVL